MIQKCYQLLDTQHFEILSLYYRLTIGLGVSLALLTIELVSFLAGVSMFSAGIGMLCILLQLNCNPKCCDRTHRRNQ